MVTQLRPFWEATLNRRQRRSIQYLYGRLWVGATYYSWKNPWLFHENLTQEEAFAYSWRDL